jgi:tRNA threonylcarbamoyl adenosine modification protein YeaZ
VSVNSLFIDVSTNLCSVLLQKGTERVERLSSGRGIHSEDLFAHIQSVLAEAEISAGDISSIYLTAGPGSYTGLRIGASAVKGFVFGRKKTVSVYQMHTLPVFAIKAELATSTIHGVMNARRKHLFYQEFNIDEEGVLRSNADQAENLLITDVEKVVQPGDIVVGTGIERLDETVRSVLTLDPIEELNTAVLMLSLLENQLKAFQNPEESPFIEKVEPETFEPYYYSPGHAQVQHS